MAAVSAHRGYRRDPLCIFLGIGFQEGVWSAEATTIDGAAYRCIYRHSASVPPATLDEVKKRTGFKPNVPVHNFGNNRDNIILEVPVLPRKNMLEALDFLVQEDNIPKTIVYFDSIKVTMLACRRLRSDLVQ